MKKICSILMVLVLSGCAGVFNKPICVQKQVSVAEISKIKLAGVIHYADGKSDLSGDDWTLLSQIAEQAKKTKAKVAVYGHASHRTKTQDPLQRILINIKVSNDRAVKVMSGLWAYGVPLAEIKTMAMFDTRPVAEETDRKGEQANRRTEIYLYW